MLPAPYRLRGKRNFQRVQASPHVVRTKLLAMRIVRRNGGRTARVSIAVGRWVSKRAVDRNRITRWLRESVRILLPRLRSGVDLRLSATAPAAYYSYRQCVVGVETLLKKADLLQK
ncbi:MAG: ribonuclease P protein component [Parcubacteria group bacterium Gr01-1014_38]|nr:MAG: ribonuclease P protein component [Parcubacteria group bacterium Gr01-1014_38]